MSIQSNNDVFPNISPYIATTICMIRPNKFAFNTQTATNNVNINTQLNIYILLKTNL
jgi:hypothetical protein